MKPAHPRHQIRLRRFQQQMIMIAHQHITVNPKPRPFAQLPQGLQKQFAVLLPSKNRLPPVPSAHHVIHRSLIFDSYASWHARLSQATLTLARAFCFYVRTPLGPGLPVPFTPDPDLTQQDNRLISLLTEAFGIMPHRVSIFNSWFLRCCPYGLCPTACMLTSSRQLLKK